VVPDVEELTSGPPHEVAAENAYRKAVSVLGERTAGLRERVASGRGEQTASAKGQAPGALILGVDTLVCLGSRIYGKPADQEDAGATLRALAGRRHAVVSGLCLIDVARADGGGSSGGGGRGGGGGRPRTSVAMTLVGFRALDEALIEWYLNTGEWRERAGGYAIQGAGAALIAGIEGDYTGVVGLPVATLLELAPGLLGVP